ncbi:hypothetical protein HBI25_231700 [Parastagonospora nodorum]|nr:hypothetical protein HBH51_217090 [Parastagonospora nodorum]KAH3967362.1 hypothetical protein HBH52_186320 [Parastagonospora nodorum]KAH4151598.1 hypothetical protein HBH43_238920 [Parastagonospora nodorum]KAH4251242.1 hypothetical protein HBI03_227850 [Parastagonospora nodorum]KAH4257269.1 hypothetical protein HBI04_225290 [Parastagonospora nodorum]
MARKTTYNESTILYDITSISVQMRKMVYNCAKTQASSGRKVIVSAGVDRVQEAFALESDKFSDIFVDHNVDLTKGPYTDRTKRIVKYNTNKPMKAQLKAISSKPGNILVFQGTIESSMEADGVLDCLSASSITVVFSFSMSFCIEAIKTLQKLNVPVHGRSSASAYLEPIMYSDSITGMKMAMDVMLWLNWEPVADSRDIMKGRAIDLEDVSNKTFEVIGDGFPSLSIAVVAITATFTAGYLTMTLVEDGLGFGQSQ